MWAAASSLHSIYSGVMYDIVRRMGTGGQLAPAQARARGPAQGARPTRTSPGHRRGPRSCSCRARSPALVPGLVLAKRQDRGPRPGPVSAAVLVLADRPGRAGEPRPCSCWCSCAAVARARACARVGPALVLALTLVPAIVPGRAGTCGNVLFTKPTRRLLHAATRAAGLSGAKAGGSRRGENHITQQRKGRYPPG